MYDVGGCKMYNCYMNFVNSQDVHKQLGTNVINVRGMRCNCILTHLKLCSFSINLLAFYHESHSLTSYSLQYHSKLRTRVLNKPLMC